MIDQIVIGSIEAKLKVKIKKFICPYHYDYLYGYDCMSIRRDSLVWLHHGRLKLKY